jgi:DNA polymerase
MAERKVPVGGDVETIGVAEARSALAWWLEAGVDVAVQESPRDWLKPAPPKEKAPSEPAPVSNIAEPDADTLSQLHQWLASSAQLPLAAVSTKRILPHGPENAAVMLLSDAPTLEDAASAQPIGGDSWALATRMLRSIGIPADRAYSASLSCLHAPGTKIDDTDRAALAEVARRHIRLAKPQRLILFGDGPCLALLGRRLIEARGHVHKVEGVRAVATFHPRHLINRPLDKSLAWRDLLLLMEDES